MPTIVTPSGWRLKRVPAEDRPYIPRRPFLPKPPRESRAERHLRLAIREVRKLQHFADLAWLNDYQDPHSMGTILEAMLDDLDDRLNTILEEVRHGG